MTTIADEFRETGKYAGREYLLDRMAKEAIDTATERDPFGATVRWFLFKDGSSMAVAEEPTGASDIPFNSNNATWLAITNPYAA